MDTPQNQPGRVLNTGDLLRRGDALRVAHNGTTEYVLRSTRNGSLLLNKPTPHDPADPGSRDFSNAPLVDSDELLNGEQFVEILHLGRIYFLRRTKSGKLILGT